MRIISGTKKGKKLKSSKSWDVRPTADRVKEALFNILTNKICFEDKYFLDLFAGTGNIGIEALSRGASHVVFIEKEFKNIKIILENLNETGFTNQSEVIRANTFDGIKRLSQKGIGFDFIFLDPPYNQGLVNPTLLALIEAGIINAEGMIIVEHHRNEQPKENLGKLKLFSQRTYGDTRVSFYCLNSVKIN